MERGSDQNAAGDAAEDLAAKCAKDTSEPRAHLTDTELADALLRHVLPVLDYRSLIMLACTCSGLHDLAQDLLQRRHTAKSNIAAGKAGTILEVYLGRESHWATFSPCSTRLLVIGCHTIAVFNIKDGTLLWQKAQEDFERDCCGRHNMSWDTCGHMFDEHWHHGAEVVSACGFVEGRLQNKEQTKVHALHLAKFNSLTGAVLASHMLHCNTIDVLAAWWEADPRLC
ncbi:hypothetical protein WJX73_001131 [Symbiochloris irregularis]|uniref:F-box domain-containing protein n=1 Tax=Symbiochloris irregularis TaxID=706552 RepID=A0AAW1NVW7_9CHLO